MTPTTARVMTALFAAVCAFHAPGIAAQDSGRGASVYQLCTSCHGPEGAGDSDFHAPAIAGMGAWYVKRQLENYRSGARGTHFDDLEGLRMRPMSRVITEDDVAIIAEYVAAMPKVIPPREVEGGDPARGETHYATCAACHGAAGEGNEAMNAPRLAGTSDWYLLKQLRKFRSGVRGANPANPIAIMMRPMAMALPDEQALLDVVAYISTLAEQQ